MPYYLYAALLQIILALTPSASNVVIRYVPIELFAAIRFTISGFLFLILVLVKQRGFSIDRNDFPKLMLLGIATYGLASLGTLYGLKYGGVVNFAMASSLNPIIVALVSIVFLNEKVGSKFFLAGFLSIIGGIILFSGKYQLSGMFIAGNSFICIISAYFMEALGFVFSKRFKEKYLLIEYLAVLQLSGATFMWLNCYRVNLSPTSLSTLPFNVWVFLLFVSFVACFFCYLVLYWLLNFIEGYKLAFFDCFHTISVALFGILFFSEHPNGWMIFGGFLLLVSVYIVSLSQSKVTD